MRLALASLALILLVGAAVAGVTRDTLWVVTRACVSAQSAFGRPFPCLHVELGGADAPGFAVLKAPMHDTEVVVMPTARVVGIEDRSLAKASGAAYWRAAVASRHYVIDALKGRLNPSDVALAVNSEGGRSQDQLHIHLDCVQPSVRAALSTNAGVFTGDWKPLPFALKGERYFGRFVRAADLAALNPFALLGHLPGRHDLRATSLALVNTAPGDPAKGAYLLAYRSDDSHAERLLDHGCGIAAKTAAQ